jgi:hypothetical protein
MVCEIDAWRGYVYGEFIAIQNRGWVIARSSGFRWPRRKGVPPQSAAAERCLARLRERLVDLGWEYEGVTRGDAWYAMILCRADHSVRSPLPAASQRLAAAVAAAGLREPEPEPPQVGEVRLNGPQPHKPAGPEALSLVQPEPPAEEPREDGRHAIAATADAGRILAQAIQPNTEVEELPHDAGERGVLSTADARPVPPPADQSPTIVEEPAQDVDHLPASAVAGAGQRLAQLEGAPAPPDGEPLANAGGRDQAGTSLAPGRKKRLRLVSRLRRA